MNTDPHGAELRGKLGDELFFISGHQRPPSCSGLSMASKSDGVEIRRSGSLGFVPGSAAIDGFLGT